MLKRSVLGAGTLLVAMVVGCSGDEGTGLGPGPRPGVGGDHNPPDPFDKAGTDAGAQGGGGAGGEGGQRDLGRLSTLMRRATECSDLAEEIRDDLRAKIEAELAAQAPRGTGGTAGSIPGSFGGSASPPTVGGASSGGQFSGSGGSGGSSSGSGDGPVFTGTNTQVPNVDEPDFVKTDGKHLYVLQAGALRVATAYPAESLAELTSAAVEGTARELLLSEGETPKQKRLVVYSDVEAQSVLRSAGLEPGQDYSPFVKVTLLTFDENEAALTTDAEYYFEGSYVSARRTEQRVRQVLSLGRAYPAGLRTWPTDADNRKAELLVLEQLGAKGSSVSELTSADLDKLFREALLEVLTAENEAVLSNIKGEDWVPRAFQRQGDTLVATNIACQDVFIPEAGTLDASITYVPEFDVDKPGAAPRGAAILGGSQTLYQNESQLVLASPPSYSYDADGNARTYLHAFDVGTDEPLAYRASGVVEGSVAGQFSLDERSGAFRVVTSLSDASGPYTQLFSLAAEGTDLNVVGQTPALAVGETLRSVRFVGDTAYVVTFRNVDPLFVIDLTDPEQPTELAELEIPGFSQYMHPIGDTHLLTIGQTGDFSATVMLRLFDVSNKAEPIASFSYEFAGFGSSDAQIDHRAFTFFADRGLLAIPFSGYAYDWDYGHFVNQLALLKVDTKAGFEELGSIDGLGLAASLREAGACSWDSDYSARFERGTFINDTLYAIARHGVVAADVSAPATPLATLPLATPCEAGGIGGSGSIGGGPGTAGSSSVGGGAGPGGQAAGGFGVGGSGSTAGSASGGSSG